MAETTEQILSREADALIQELRAKYVSLGMPASGLWGESLENRSRGLTLSIWGQDYTEFLTDGRKPGKFPPIAIIRQWILDKGIKPIGDNITISSLAFLIARKIAREGTEYFKQGGTDLISGVITPRRIQDILDQVGTVVVSEFVSTFVKDIQKIAA